MHNTILLFPAKKLDTIEFVFNHELKLLVQYLQCNKISSNETKTELIIIRTPWKHLQRETDIKINNYRLKLHLGTTAKYLGVPIGAVLFWNKQIDNICTKLFRANSILWKLRHFVHK